MINPLRRSKVCVRARCVVIERGCAREREGKECGREGRREGGREGGRKGERERESRACDGGAKWGRTRTR